MKKLFWLGIFLIPFDNISFAPSSGWAALSPYIFLAFFILNFPASINEIASSINKFSATLFASISYLILTSIISWMNYGIDASLFTTGLLKLILGISFFCSLQIIIAVDKNWLKNTIFLLSISYTIALFVGIVQYVNILHKIGVSSIFEVIFSRYYEDKVQFTFTEPSFASVHVFGIIVPLIFVAAKNNIETTWLRNISYSIVILSIISGSSVRILIDASVVALVYILSEVKKINFKYFLRIIPIIFLIFTLMPDKYVARFNSVFSESQQDTSDPSKEIRLFRSESAIYGITNEKVKLFFGVGFLNSHIAMIDGYSEAFSKIKEPYPEIITLYYKPDGLTYSMISKWIAEFGILGFILLITSIINKRILFLYFCMIVSYIQFDSYAFYSLWMYSVFSIRSLSGKP